MVTRTQIVLDSELHQKARQKAQDLGISLAEYVRRVVAVDLASVPIATDISAIFDLGDSGARDIANEKERYLGESMDRERQR